MTYEEDRVVTSTPVDGADVVETTPVTQRVVEARPAAVRRTVVDNGDPVATSMAASNLIQTIVWAVVVLVLLVVGIYLLIHFGLL